MMPGAQFNPQMMVQQQMMQQQGQHHHPPQHHPGGHNPMMHAQHHPQQMPGQQPHHPQQHHQMQHHPQGTPQQRMRTASQSSQPHFHGTPVPGQGGAAGGGGGGGGGAGSASSATPAKRRGPPGHTVAAAAAQGGGASAAAMAALQPVAPDEEDTSHGDFLDFVTPREIANHRFQLMYEYMEEVFSSPYKASQIIDPEDATGGLLLAARLSLTEGLFDAKGAPVGDLTRDQACAKVSERAKKMVDDTNKEMSTLEQRHKRTLEKFHKRGEVLKQVYREQRKESYEVWNDFAREMGMMQAEPSFRGTAAYTYDSTTEKPRGPEELTKVVESLYDINIETDREALKVVQQGQGFITEEMRREAEAARQEFLLANASPINETTDELLQDDPADGENAAAGAATAADTTGAAATGAAEGTDAAAVFAAAALPSSTTGKDPVAVIPVVIGNTYNNASSAPAEPSQVPSTTAAAAAPSIPTASPAATAAIATTPAAQPPQPTPPPPAAAGTPAAAPVAPAEAPQDNDISMMDAQPDDSKDINSGDNGNDDMTMEEDTVGMMLDDLDMTAAAGDMSSSANATPIPPVTTANIPSPQPPVPPTTTADSSATPGNVASPQVLASSHSAAGTPAAAAPVTAGTPGGLTPGESVGGARSPAFVKSPSPLPNTATPEMEQKFKEPTPSAIEPSKEISSTDEPPTVPGEEYVPEEFITNDNNGGQKDKSPSLGLKSPAGATPGLESIGAGGAGTPGAGGALDVPTGGEQKAASPKPEGSGGDAPAPA